MSGPPTVHGRSRTSDGVAAVAFAAASIAAFSFEAVGRTGRFDDGDDPLESLGLFSANRSSYELSGLSLVVASLALTWLVFAALEVVLTDTSPVGSKFVTGVGLFSAAFLFVAGVIRLQAPGTVLYIESLDSDWGESAYLAVQMAGTQGVLSSGIFAFAVWAVCLAISGRRARTIPRIAVGFAILPALCLVLPLLALVGRLVGVPLPELLFPVYLAAALAGAPIFALAVGAVLLRGRVVR